MGFDYHRCISDDGSWICLIRGMSASEVLNEVKILASPALWQRSGVLF